MKSEELPQIQLLGEMRILCDGEIRVLPRSRKTRGLLAFLALSGRRLQRDHLCDLLWDGPADPRAALRWSLSKLRIALTADTGSALQADNDTINLDLGLASVDVVDIRAAMSGDREDLSHADLEEFQGALDTGCLQGLEGIGNAEYQLWLARERAEVLELHQRVIDELVTRAAGSPPEMLRLAGKRLMLDPLDTAANIRYLQLLLQVRGFTDARSAFDKACEHYKAERRPADELLAAWRQMTQSSVTSGREESAAKLVEPLALPDRPSVAVMNFADLGAHAEGSVLANGLAVDINARLAQMPNLFVTARASASRLSLGTLAAREIGQKLGVRYLLGGSTQRYKNRVRATVTLVDATEGNEIWSEHFDRSVDDLFDIQDEITNTVVAAIEPTIERAEMQRALIKPPDNLSAWESFHRGLWHSFRFTARDNEIASALFKRAASLDPHFSRAYAGISFTHYSRAFLNVAQDVEAEIDKALEAAHRCVSYENRDATGHWVLGRALFLSRHHDEALESIDRALTINPNYAQGHYAKGFIGIHAGINSASLLSLDTAERLSPFDPLLFAMKSSRAISLAAQDRVDEAAAWAISATHEPNAHFHIYAVAAACLELAGRSADARNNARWAMQRQPDYTVEVFERSFPRKQKDAAARFLGALERAGIPRTRKP